MAFGDTRAFVIDKAHSAYIENLPASMRQLIELRDTLYHGSWQTLEERLPEEKRENATVLRKYEMDHNVNLGLYLRFYIRQQRKAPA
jgi:hypothetical protein